MAAKTVLIVEDHEDNRLIFGAVLRHFGYQVLLASDGMDGLALAREQLPDLILLDISLPLLSGGMSRASCSMTRVRATSSLWG